MPWELKFPVPSKRLKVQRPQQLLAIIQLPSKIIITFNRNLKATVDYSYKIYQELGYQRRKNTKNTNSSTESKFHNFLVFIVNALLLETKKVRGREKREGRRK